MGFRQRAYGCVEEGDCLVRCFRLNGQQGGGGTQPFQYSGGVVITVGEYDFLSEGKDGGTNPFGPRFFKVAETFGMRRGDQGERRASIRMRNCRRMRDGRRA